MGSEMCIRDRDYLDEPVSKMNDLDLLQVRATYYGLMTEVDQHLGKIIKYLKESGQYDSTLIVFTSDHGEHLGDHYLFGKLGYFDQGYHIPLIVMDPEISGKNKGLQLEVFTEAIDVMPTILDWLDAEIPEECDGSSLLPLMNGTIPDNWRTEAHWEYDFRLIGTFQPLIKQKFGLSPDQCSLCVIRDDHFKYVHMVALPPLLLSLIHI